MEELVPVYEFGDGYEVRRILSTPLFRTFIGATHMPEETAAYVLVNERDRPVSATWMHTGEGERTGELNNPIGGSKMGWPRKKRWAPYWREFVEQTMSHDIADANFELPIVVPDDLVHAMSSMRPQEIELQQLIDTYSKGVGKWRDNERNVRDHMLHMLQQLFDPAGPFAQHVRVERLRYRAIEHIRIVMLHPPDQVSTGAGSEMYAYSIEFIEDLPGWKLVEERPRTRRRPLRAEGKTLAEAWRRLAEVNAKDLRPFIPQGKLDA